MEEVALSDIAEQCGTPCYVYSKLAIEQNYTAYKDALGAQAHLVCYAVKSNSNLAVLQTLADLGSGFDIVSVGELERVLLAGGDASKVVFSGLGKTTHEMQRALEVGIHCFNVESESELKLLNRVAGQMGKKAPVSIRVNPDVDAKTHPYISTGLKEDKFGIDVKTAPDVYAKAVTMNHINIVGIDCHIGSQITEARPFVDTLRRLLLLVDELQERGIELSHIDIGGGLGVRYQDEEIQPIKALVADIKALLSDRTQTLIVEPGRSLTANAGVLLTRVLYLKSTQYKHFAVVDAAMNDMLRPSLYQAWMDVQPVIQNDQNITATYDVVGPICESGDFLAKGRSLAIDEGDFLCLFSSGSYGFVMSSNYNSRPRVAEIMINGHDIHVIRQRENFDDLIKGEKLLPKSHPTISG
jgi:diaminopimelate decarboxylase